MVSSDSEWDPLTGFYGYGDGVSNSIKAGNFLIGWRTISVWRWTPYESLTFSKSFSNNPRLLSVGKYEEWVVWSRWPAALWGSEFSGQSNNDWATDMNFGHIDPPGSWRNAVHRTVLQVLQILVLHVSIYHVILVLCSQYLHLWLILQVFYVLWVFLRTRSFMFPGFVLCICWC